MKQSKAVGAYRVIQKLSNAPLDLKEAYKLFQKRKELEPCWQFECDAERQLIDKYHAEINKDGTLKLANADEAHKLVDELNKLGEIDVPDVEQVEITVPFGVTLSVNELDMLDGIVALKATERE